MLASYSMMVPRCKNVAAWIPMCSGTDRADRHRSRHAMDGKGCRRKQAKGDDASDETPELSVAVAACTYLVRRFLRFPHEC